MNRGFRQTTSLEGFEFGGTKDITQKIYAVKYCPAPVSVAHDLGYVNLKGTFSELPKDFHVR